MQVHLVDGTFELFRCFRGAPRATHDGAEVGAVRGLVATLASLLRRPEVTHVAIAFDAMAPPRGTRSGDEAALRAQAIPAIDAARALGIAVWPMTRVQADDALATGAARFAAHPDVTRIVLCTTDKDLLQCVRGDRVVCWDRIRDVVHDEPAVRARFGVAPAQLPDWFALVGDPSDGLPGVPGWGARAATAMLSAYPDLDAIPDDPDAWTVRPRGSPRLAATLAARRREAVLGRDLSRLRTDLPISGDLDAIAWRGPDDRDLDAMFASLGDPELATWVRDRLQRRILGVTTAPRDP